MPFYLYKTTGEAPETTYQQLNEIKLAGSYGPIARYAREKNAGRPAPWEWHVTERDLLVASDQQPDGHAIVIDLKPRATRNVSLFRLTDVWGFTCDDWTPIALRLSALFIDEEREGPDAFKKDFTYHGDYHEVVGEFLYLMGGATSGTWNWGMVGRVNGALLWPPALKYLATSLMDAIP